MGNHIEIIFLKNLVLDILDFRQRNFVYLSALATYKMVVLDIVHCLLVGIALVELMLYQQPCVYKNVYVVVQRSKADVIILILHRLVQGLDVEMPRIGVNLVKYSKTFRSFPQRIAFKVVLQYVVRRKPFLVHFLIIKFVSSLWNLNIAVSLAHKVLTIELLSLVVAVNKENVAQLFGILARNEIAHLDVVAVTAQRFNLLDVGIQRMHVSEY